MCLDNVSQESGSQSLRFVVRFNRFHPAPPILLPPRHPAPRGTGGRSCTRRILRPAGKEVIRRPPALAGGCASLITPGMAPGRRPRGGTVSALGGRGLVPLDVPVSIRPERAAAGQALIASCVLSAVLVRRRSIADPVGAGRGFHLTPPALAGCALLPSIQARRVPNEKSTTYSLLAQLIGHRKMDKKWQNGANLRG